MVSGVEGEWPNWTLRSEASEVRGSVERRDGLYIVTVVRQGEVFAREHYEDRRVAFARSIEFRDALIEQGWRQERA